MADVFMMPWYLLLILLSSCHHVHPFMDMEELKSVYYGLDILNEPVVVTEDLPLGAVHVTSKYGQQYQCTFPDHSTEEKRKEEEEKIAIETGIVEMLKPMGLGDCLFKSKDWWSYEFCYGKYIRQFHMEDGEIKGNIMYLGYYQEDFDWNNETAREERLKSKATLNRYHSQTYTMGSKCDLTGEMRKSEVRFMCEENSEDYLARVDESETCVYTVTIMTSRICRHPYLKAPARRKPVPITCNPLLSVEQFHDYVEEKEEKRQREQKMQIDARKALYTQGDKSETEMEQDFTKTLEEEMSNAAKELLSNPPSDLFPNPERAKLTKEKFQEKFGKDDAQWESYLKEIDTNNRQQNQHLKKMQQLRQRIEERKKKADEKGGEKGDTEKGDTMEIEDEEILAEFNDEIEEIRAKFQSSQSKLHSIKKKLITNKGWESEIEHAIKEAEEEFGVKVDRSLITGLSNTLDKLVHKLHDTEAELSSMDEEIDKLQPGKPVLKNKKKGEKEDEEKEGTFSDKDEDGSESVVELDLGQVDNTADNQAADPDDDTWMAGAGGLDGNFDDLNDKIQAPPKSEGGPAGKSPETSHIVNKQEEEDEEKKSSLTTQDGEKTDGSDGEESPEVEITLKKVETDEDINLPDGVQKLLQESVKKEFEKQRVQAGDSQPLSFDSDYSFTRDKTVHVIQQEDEDGKTNRYIFVFGFNTFNDESAESERQSSLEENYGFVYKGNKNKKRLTGS